MPEAGLHLFESVVTTDVAEVELGDIAGALVAEGEALLPGHGGGDSVASTAIAVIPTLSSTELDFSRSLNGTGISAEVHGHEGFLGVGVEIALLKTCIGEAASLTA